MLFLNSFPLLAMDPPEGEDHKPISRKSSQDQDKRAPRGRMGSQDTESGWKKKEGTKSLRRKSINGKHPSIKISGSASSSPSPLDSPTQEPERPPKHLTEKDLEEKKRFVECVHHLLSNSALSDAKIAEILLYSPLLLIDQKALFLLLDGYKEVYPNKIKEFLKKFATKETPGGLIAKAEFIQLASGFDGIDIDNLDKP